MTVLLHPLTGEMKGIKLTVEQASQKAGALNMELEVREEACTLKLEMCSASDCLLTLEAAV